MILKIDNIKNFTENDIKKINICATEIKRDGIVSFPTETVYGIGASIFSEKGIKKIFKVKNRPSDNPLIAHISDFKMLNSIVVFKDEIQRLIFYILSRKLWPGPISFILNANKNIPDIARANLPTIAVRMPDNKIAMELIKMVEVPIVAPSANLSGKPSATTAQDVYNDFEESIPFILDGGKTNIGIESTVIDLTDNNITILRPGFVTKEDLEKIIIQSNLTNQLKSKEIKNTFILERIKVKYVNNQFTYAKSPGLKYTHYKPDAETFLFNVNYLQNSSYINILKNAIPEDNILFLILNKNKNILLNFIRKSFNNSYKILYFENVEQFKNVLYDNNDNKRQHLNWLRLDSDNLNIYNTKNRPINKTILIVAFNNIYTYASNLYYIFRLCDIVKIKYIFFQKMIDKGFGISINNRLKKASDIII